MGSRCSAREAQGSSACARTGTRHRHVPPTREQTPASPRSARARWVCGRRSCRAACLPRMLRFKGGRRARRSVASCPRRPRVPCPYGLRAVSNHPPRSITRAHLARRRLQRRLAPPRRARRTRLDARQHLGQPARPAESRARDRAAARQVGARRIALCRPALEPRARAWPAVLDEQLAPGALRQCWHARRGVAWPDRPGARASLRAPDTHLRVSTSAEPRPMLLPSKLVPLLTPPSRSAAAAAAAAAASGGCGRGCGCGSLPGVFACGTGTGALCAKPSAAAAAKS